MAHIHELIKEVLNDRQPSALATIVHVEGSAYRREGACIRTEGQQRPNRCVKWWLS